MRIRNLNTFIKVARLGSFHAAAQHLHASQPAISARIVALEDELGVQLFSRDKSGTRLTARGTQLLPYAEKLVAISLEMKSQLQDGAPARGILRIGVADTLAQLWLAPLLEHWREQYPLMEFELTIDISRELWKQLQSHRLDLALMVFEEHSPDLVTEPLCSYPQRWVASPKLLIDKRAGAADPLVQHPILSFPRQTRPWQYLQQLLKSLGDQEPMLHTCSSVANLLALAEQGSGIALLPEPLIADPVSEGKLVIINQDSQPPELEFCISWRVDDDRMLPRLLAETGRQIVR